MIWLGYAALYLGIHFLAYTLALRHLRLFAREPVIFLYQFLSFMFHPALLFWVAPRPEDLMAALLGSFALHGIYSLSFLELWALSEGSYSLRMLDKVERLGSEASQSALSDLEEIGASKKNARLESLVRLRLIEQRDGRYFRRPAGWMMAAVLRTLVWLVNIRDRIG